MNLVFFVVVVAFLIAGFFGGKLLKGHRGFAVASGVCLAAIAALWQFNSPGEVSQLFQTTTVTPETGMLWWKSEGETFTQLTRAGAAYFFGVLCVSTFAGMGLSWKTAKPCEFVSTKKSDTVINSDQVTVDITGNSVKVKTEETSDEEVAAKVVTA